MPYVTSFERIAEERAEKRINLKLEVAIKEARGILKDSKFNTEKFREQKQLDKELKS